MEEVLDKFDKTIVSETVGSAYEYLFKNRGRHGSQDERRKCLLESQKRQREDSIDASRGILQLVDDVEAKMEWKECDNQDSNKARYRPSTYVAGFHRTPTYQNTLMLSEWLVERPSDLEEWYITPCPKGVRVLVVAYKGRTSCYSRRGHHIFSGRSLLPGGELGGGRSTTVLDCVWQESASTLHVLDLLAWNNQSMTDCETEFRHFWLASKAEESPSLKEFSKRNYYKFSLLPKVTCTRENLQQVMSMVPMVPGCELDGLLFYHKRAHYTSGETPLVGWLYPYMVAEIIGGGTRIGSGADEIHTTKWFAYNEIKDLMASNTPKHSFSKLSESEKEDEYVSKHRASRNSSMSTPPPDKLPSSQILLSTSRYTQETKNTVYKEAMPTLKPIDEKKKEALNDLQSYASYIVDHLSKYTPLQREKAKDEITRVLLQLDMENLEVQEPVCEKLEGHNNTRFNLNSQNRKRAAVDSSRTSFEDVSDVPPTSNLSRIHNYDKTCITSNESIKITPNLPPSKVIILSNDVYAPSCSRVGSYSVEITKGT